jgi:hypothetical protein
MSDGRDETATDQEPREQHETSSSRRPWLTPRVIVSDARDTENATVVLDDGPSSNS